MKKLLLLAMVLGLLVGGCIGSTGWVKKNGQQLDSAQFEKDREECNRGWGICLTVDILVTGGFVSLIHYFEARHCIHVKGYERASGDRLVTPPKEVKEADPKQIKEPTRSTYMAHSGPYARHYHRSDCSVGLKAIPPDQRKYLSEKEAKYQGLIPCPICKPHEMDTGIQ